MGEKITMAKKTLTLREKIEKIVWDYDHAPYSGVTSTDGILRLIRAEQKRKCGECQYRKNYLKSVYGTKK
jgi:hypothetical protein